jgi:signal transduction histidine kinase
VAVADSGRGIPSDLIGQIFDPFFTTRPVGQGSGLGLAISDSIVRQHHGTIAVDSHPGAGSTFTVRLPIAEQAWPNAEPPA